MLTLNRLPENPILLPSSNDWEKKAAFNGSVVDRDGVIHMVYRALSSTTYYEGHSMSLSTVGYTSSTDGKHFSDHKQLLKPEHPWELFGCEDPRVTFFEGKYYIFYTALSQFPFSAPGIKVGVAVTKDFKEIEERHLVTPFNAKAMGLFPERVNGKIAVILAANTDLPPAKISIALVDEIEELFEESFWNNWYTYLDDHTLQLLRDSKDQVEVGAVPVKTDRGWLLIYSYIRDYHTDHKVFGIEAALLDLDDPKKVVARVVDPLLVPEKDYEKFGDVPNIVFPTGAVVRQDELHVYYGGADTNTCVATCNLNELLDSMSPVDGEKKEGADEQVSMVRFEENPILSPIPGHKWEEKAVFNPAAFYDQDKFHIVYRAMSNDNVSTFGYAMSLDGFHINERLSEPIYTPREVFEKPDHGGVGSGCEDPRITKIDDRFYMLYTAYDGEHPPRVAMSSISSEDFHTRKWHWSLPKLISPPEIDDKDACILPKKIKDKYMIFHRLETAIWIDYVDDLHFYEGQYLGGKILFASRPDGWDSSKIGISSVPIETDEGWILLYHGITKDHVYKVGAALLDLENPERIISRLNYPILSPDMQYEKNGQVGNVVFPCGSAVKDGIIYVYYGGGDSVTGVATIPLEDLLKALLR